MSRVLRGVAHDKALQVQAGALTEDAISLLRSPTREKIVSAADGPKKPQLYIFRHTHNQLDAPPGFRNLARFACRTIARRSHHDSGKMLRTASCRPLTHAAAIRNSPNRSGGCDWSRSLYAISEQGIPLGIMDHFTSRFGTI